MSEFKQDTKYIVLKISDAIEALSLAEKDVLEGILEKVGAYRTEEGKPILACAVVEADWPEYEPLWEAIEKRVKAEGRCLQCGSATGVKEPRGLEPYCEDCGWPDEDFGEENE